MFSKQFFKQVDAYHDLVFVIPEDPPSPDECQCVADVVDADEDGPIFGCQQPCPCRVHSCAQECECGTLLHETGCPDCDGDIS